MISEIFAMEVASLYELRKTRYAFCVIFMLNRVLRFRFQIGRPAFSTSICATLFCLKRTVNDSAQVKCRT